jgi:hypothetical protein
VLFAAAAGAAGGAEGAAAGACAAGAGDADAGGFDGAGASDVAGDEDRRFDADEVGWGEALATGATGALLTVTSGVIFLMVAAETPALDKSLAEA